MRILQNPSKTNGYGSRNPFHYRGYYFDSDLGMHYLTTRYYDPKTGTKAGISNFGRKIVGFWDAIIN